jgi:sugar phosphate isomerase/epimerase
MKIAVAVATEDALPTAFVVFRGIEESIRKAAELGYDGIELALMDKDQVSVERVERLIREYGLAIPVVSTGQVFAGHGLWFTDPDGARRRRAVEIFKGLVEVAAEFGAMVNMGRVRGFIPEGETAEVAERRFGDVVREIAAYARPKSVELLLEPVNRYEINFINSVDEGAALLERLAIPGLKLMPDVFHMNIEDVSIEGSLQKHIGHIAYVHFADSNRLAPGWGHLDFGSIVGALDTIGYTGWTAVEILPQPDPDSAARQAIQHLRKYIPKES